MPSLTFGQNPLNIEGDYPDQYLLTLLGFIDNHLSALERHASVNEVLITSDRDDGAAIYNIPHFPINITLYQDGDFNLYHTTGIHYTLRDHHLSSDDPEFTALYQYTYPGSDNTILLTPQDRDTISHAVKARVFRMVHK